MKPESFFCDYGLDEPAEAARKRYPDNTPAVVLTNRSGSAREKNGISIVSLLDVEDEKLMERVRESLADERCGLISCRRMLKKQISRKPGVHAGS